MKPRLLISSSGIPSSLSFAENVSSVSLNVFFSFTTLNLTYHTKNITYHNTHKHKLQFKIIAKEYCKMVTERTSFNVSSLAANI